MMNIRMLVAAASAVLALSQPSIAQPLEKISIVHFSAPSLGAFLPPVIKANKFDEKNGLSIEYKGMPPDAYISAFNSGQYEVSSSAAAMTVGLAQIRGADIVNLFNVFDFWCTVVTSNPEITTVKQLEDKTIAAAKGTISYVMFEWLARKQQVDLAKVSVISTATPGLVGYAIADRADAVQLWEPAYSLLKAQKPSTRMLNLRLTETWKSEVGSDVIPYQGVAAHRKWAEANPHLVKKLYDTYKAAGKWISENPQRAAEIILPKGSKEEIDAIVSLISTPSRLALNVAWAKDMTKEIKALYDIGVETGYLSKMPSMNSIYEPRK